MKPRADKLNTHNSRERELSQGRWSTLYAAAQHVDETLVRAGGADLLQEDRAMDPSAAAAIMDKTVDFVPVPADVAVAEGGSALSEAAQDALSGQLAGLGYTAVNPEAN